MICGEPNIWPIPTGKTTVSSRSLTLTSDTIALHIDTKFPKVQQQLQTAFDIFLQDLQSLESSTTGGVSGNAGSTSDEKTGRSDKEAVQLQSLAEEQQRNCDIKKVTVRIAVTSIADVHLHMDMDESYNLTVASKFL